VSAVIEARPIHPTREGRRRWTTTAAAALIGLAALVAGLLVAAPANAALPAPKEQIIQRILDETNAIRASVGAAPLVLNSSINVVAENWSRQQAAAGVMSHNPNYSSQIPGGWRAAGENVAYGYRYTEVTTAWRNSPGHYKNMVGDYTDIGIGVAEAADGSLYYTQNFAKYPGTVVYPVDDRLKSYWDAKGGASGVVGRATGSPVTVANGWYQAFAGGHIFVGPPGTFFVANNGYLAAYVNAGGPGGSLGWPTGEQTCTTEYRCAQSFTGATISTSPSFGTRYIWSGLRDYWLASGGIGGSLGPAAGDQGYAQGPAGAGWYQAFQGGYVVLSAAGGTQFVPYSTGLSFWLASGGGASGLGWPTGGYSCGGSGCAQQFSGGVIASSVYGAQLISGGFVSEWANRGGINGTLGAPVSGLRGSAAPNLGWAQSFAGGTLTVSSASGARIVPWGPGQQIWSAAGEQNGFGWPSTDRTCASGVCQQGFGSAIIFESRNGAFATYGGIAAIWRQQGGMATLGAPVGGTRYSTDNGGGFAQHFDGGIITHSNAGGPQYTPYGAIVGAWYKYGAEATWMGWPAGPQTCDTNRNCTQKFQNATARSDANGGVAFTRN